MKTTARLLRKLLCSCPWFYPPGNAPKNAKKVIYLTFDDGPHPIYSNIIMDILADYGIKATFFLLGSNIEKNLGTAQRMVDEGHVLGNHTYSHQILPKIGRAERIVEIEQCQNLIEKLQKQPRLFRPPQGLMTITDTLYLLGLQYRPMLWTVDSKDHLFDDKIINRLENLPNRQNIVLFHDDNGACAEPLRYLLPLWVKQGITFAVPC